MARFRPGVVASIALLGTSAHADDKAQCVAAVSAAQDLRAAQKLTQARDELRVCARESCPAVVRRDCVQWLGEVEAALPTAVVTAKDERGADVPVARVTLDGRPWLERLDSKAVALDPGVHVIRVEATDARAIERTVTIREGEKNRVLDLDFETPRPTQPTHGEPAVPPSGQTSRVVGIAVAALGIVGLGAGAFFGFKASSQWSDAKDACGKGCTEGSPAYSIRDDAERSATISTLSFLVGGVLVVGGAVLFLTSGPPAVAAKRPGQGHALAF